MNNDAGTTDMYAALRLTPKKNVNVDIGFYKSIETSSSKKGGKKGSKTSTTTTTTTSGIPLYFRLTLIL